MQIANEEMVTARELGRDYAKLMKRLAEGEIGKFVITKHGKIEAVVLSAEDYEALVDGSR